MAGISDAQISKLVDKTRYSRMLCSFMFVGWFCIAAASLPSDQKALTQFSFAIGGMCLLAAVYNHAILISPDAETMLRREDYSEAFKFTLITAGWALCAAQDGTSLHTLSRLLSVFVTPVAFAREASSSKTWLPAAGAHLLVTCVCLRGDLLGEGWQFLAPLLMLDGCLWDSIQAKQYLVAANRNMKALCVRLAQVAEETTERVFSDVCCAVATLNSELRLAKPPERLTEMLGRCAEGGGGRKFEDFVHVEDMQHFVEEVQEMTADVNIDDARGSCSSRSRSIKVHLTDAYLQPISVVLFCTALVGVGDELIYILGISEGWKPPKGEREKARKTRREGDRKSVV